MAQKETIKYWGDIGYKVPSQTEWNDMNNKLQQQSQEIAAMKKQMNTMQKDINTLNAGTQT